MKQVNKLNLFLALLFVVYVSVLQSARGECDLSDPCCCPPYAQCIPPDPGECPEEGDCEDKFGNSIPCPPEVEGDVEIPPLKCYDKFGNQVTCPPGSGGGGSCDCCNPLSPNFNLAVAMAAGCDTDEIVGKITITPIPPGEPCSGKAWIGFPRPTVVGHTMWKFETLNGFSLPAGYSYLSPFLGRHSGFYPKDAVDCGQTVDGKVELDDRHSNDPKPVCLEFQLKKSELLSGLYKAKQLYDNPPGYNLCSYNCSTAAISVLSASGKTWGNLPLTSWFPICSCTDGITPGGLAKSICKKNGNTAGCPVSGN